MIRVLHFVSTPSIGSGVMSVIMNYYRYMDRSKIQFDFLCFIPCEESYETEINELGGQVFFVSKPGSSLDSIFELKQFLAKNGSKYQYLHNHEVYLSFFLEPMAKKFGIPKVIVHCHATRYSDHKLAAIRNAVLCLPIRFMRCEKFACSKAAGTFLYGEKALQTGSVSVFQNAIIGKKYQFNLEKREQQRRQLGIADDVLVLGHVGRFAPQKNHKYLLEIFKELQNVIPKSYLLCIGDGPLRKEIEQLADKMGILNQIMFLGQRKDIDELLNVMDIFILPSLYEGFPVSLVEAGYNGLPCVVADTVADEISIDSIQRISLDAAPAVWAEKIADMACVDHKPDVVLPEFDIQIQSRKLQDFYLKKAI